MLPEQFEGDVPGYSVTGNSAQKKGLLGTAVFVKTEPDDVTTASASRSTTTRAA
jgi:exonuclease III